MNAVEIEAAISALAEQSFDGVEFPFAFLEAFGNKATTIKRLRTGSTNKSDVGGLLQTNNIHIAVAESGAVSKTLEALKASPATSRAKAKFILATDGKDFEAEDLQSGETVACAYQDFPDHFGFFLPLAGISTVKQISDNAFDIRATSRLNRLYLELLKDNPDWGSEAQRHEMNHFMARLIFCFFAEDTDIFSGTDLFTDTITKMSARDSANTHEVIGEIFRAMNTAHDLREKAKLPRWTNGFPYVNGGLFSGSVEVPRFSKISRSYLLHIGSLDWTQINPDIFGSMIQAVADEEERGSLGMHYTSVPNILKVLNPLLLDDLREQLEQAKDSSRKLLNLRNRLARIRVFDPACGSGNFLVIAYKQMREIENIINERRGETGRKSDIPLTNFRGIELRDFSAEIARLALIIAEYQCDVRYRGQQEALQEFLPLDAENWITQGNALRLDWFSICPPTGTGVKHHSDDLFEETNQAEIDFENEGGETYICGNPPYLGSTWQSAEQKHDLKRIFEGRTKSWKSLDYVAGWFMKAADYGLHTPAASAFVSTNSICQGQQVPILWPLIFESGHEITFAHASFKWANLASHNAGVTVVIVGISNQTGQVRRLYSKETVKYDGTARYDASIFYDGTTRRDVSNINAYLVAAPHVVVHKASKPSDGRGIIEAGGKPVEGGNLLLNAMQAAEIIKNYPSAKRFIKRVYGASEYIRGDIRYCIWISDSDMPEAANIADFGLRFEAVAKARRKSSKVTTQNGAQWPYKFEEAKQDGDERVIIVPKVSSETREYLPVGLLPPGSIITDLAFGIFDAPLWNLALIASRLHLVWIAIVCGKMKTDFRYSNTLGWNTFPVPTLTEKNKSDLTRCAEDILLAREAHFPATIADLYKPDSMPDNLRAAHEHNDEVLERIYIGRRFKNDTERLEKLFELYTKMTSSSKKAGTV
ncbi:type II restriction enzyme methylase subunit [Alcanivorax hongdengensis A-11-3]|uniref:site-specific DNA-methyltransferase (adenine-specific) n=1 Tax=Alcanivorax hongdengensis A-11-3 TaxID=1177179 RepID=L0W8A1_9GAMM|nr:DNA methyltransferase [Alcanivorax hongdengensis]EKF72928.1 type II restriction enzyme methylase subunit [Alcanivorax hongdengensis A-11-3]